MIFFTLFDKIKYGLYYKYTKSVYLYFKKFSLYIIYKILKLYTNLLTIQTVEPSKHHQLCKQNTEIGREK